MSGEINWKQKYQELKSKYMNAVDMAFRLGVEEGLKQGQLDSANQQLAQASAQQQDQAAAGGAEGADPSAGGGAGGKLPGAKQNNNGAAGVPDQGNGQDKAGAPSIQPNPVSENPEGSELDQHIQKLESMIAKSEQFDVKDLKETINDLKSLQKSQKEQLELRKSQMAISGIAKAMHKPQFKFGVQATHNLSSTAKAAVTMQHEIVQDVFKKWEEEEKKASKDILSTLNIEGIVKGE
jgi:hypothetical protein